MINHVWSILAQSSSIDNDTNDLSIFNVLNNIVVYAEVGSEINLPIKFEIISLWEKGDEEVTEQGNTRLTFNYPDGSKKLMFEEKLDLSKTHFHRTRVRFLGMVLSKPGKHLILVELKQAESKRWKKVGKLPILVSFKAPEERSKESR